MRGTPALQAYASKTWGAVSTIETSRTMVGEARTPNAVLKSTKKLTEEQAYALKTSWLNARASSGGAPAILPPELDFEQLAFSPKDLLLLDSQKFDASVICSAFGVPAFMLNIALEGALVYQNPESLFEYWWRGELRPMAGTIAAALTANMLPRGASVSFDATETIEPNVVDNVAAWSSMLASGVVTVNEFRAAVLGLPPLAEGDAIKELTQPPVSDVSPNSGVSTPVTDLKVVTA
jgi:HK97 family phage portal protein